MNKIRVYILIGFLLFSCSTIVKPKEEMALPPKTLIFTFDDGPNERWNVTWQVLDILKKYQIKAFFSLIGTRAKSNPHLVKRIYDEGHVIVNHTMHHDPSIIGGIDQVAREFDDADRVFGEILGITNYRSRFIRAPMGLITGAISDYMKERNSFVMPVTFFNGDSEATSNDHDRVVNEMISEFEKKDGGILLFHDGVPRFHYLWEHEYSDPNNPADRIWIPEAVEKVILYFIDKGYRFNLPEDGMEQVMKKGFLTGSGS